VFLKQDLIAPTHIIIPDTQCRPDVPTDALGWIGQYIVDEFSKKPKVKIIHLGDHADMPSLSQWDNKREMEGRRYLADIEAANRGFDVLNAPLNRYNKERAKIHKTVWKPEKHFLLGNHENRIERAASIDPKLDGTISVEQLNYAKHGWKVHGFLTPVSIDGVIYSHYFYQPQTGKPYGGNSIDTRLKNIGTSFTMGHQQMLMYGLRFVNGKSQHGLVAGAAYLHIEDYRGPQANAHWRGIIVKHEVVDGSYDPMFISLNYLCRRYEGQTLDKFMSKSYGYTLHSNASI